MISFIVCIAFPFFYFILVFFKSYISIYALHLIVSQPWIWHFNLITSYTCGFVYVLLCLCKTSKGQIGRKRKQPVSSSGPANSSGTGNTAGPSPSSAPSTPSTHTPGDVISMPTLSHNGGSSKSLLMYGSDGMGTHTSAPNQLVRNLFF